MTEPVLYVGMTTRCRNCERTGDGSVMPCPHRSEGRCEQSTEPHTPEPYDPAKHGAPKQ